MSRRAATFPAVAAPAADWLALDHQLCFALYAASLAMTKAYKPLLAPLGITYPQYLAMLVLWEGDGITVSQLGDRLTLDSGTLTPLLKRLESLGLVQRQRDVADERRVLLRLTASGHALRAQALAVPQAIACATACDLQQIGSLANQLHQLRRQLAASMASPVSPPAAPASAAAVPPRP
jgi:MarR family transcriptional regulator, organic hydroperoxide resistance regulator